MTIKSTEVGDSIKQNKFEKWIPLKKCLGDFHPQTITFFFGGGVSVCAFCDYPVTLLKVDDSLFVRKMQWQFCFVFSPNRHCFHMRLLFIILYNLAYKSAKLWKEKENSLWPYPESNVGLSHMLICIEGPKQIQPTTNGFLKSLK